CKRTVSGTLSLRSSRCLSSFSHLTDSLSVVEEYFALEGGPPMFSPGSTSPNLLYGPRCREPLQGFHLLRPGFPACSRLKQRVRFRSPLLTESRLIHFPPGTEMFQFPGFASRTYAFSTR